jgi:hypothetical protein
MGCSNGQVNKEKANKITQANYDKINNGMTEAEVEAILGQAESTPMSTAGAVLAFAPDGVDIGGGIHVKQVPSKGGLSDNGQVKLWKAESKAIAVIFVSGKAADKKAEGL